MNPDRPTVLVVDDVASNIGLLSDALSDSYNIIAAKNGQMALKVAQKNDQPDIILLDVVMPEMDGYEVIKVLKNNPLTAHIPVIFVSAKSSVVDEEYGLTLGAVDYITKPISPPIVRARVHNHVELSRLIHMSSNQL